MSASGITWIASFPKSGNTWFRVFLANLSAGPAAPVDINNLREAGFAAADRHEFELMTLLDSGLLSHDEIDVLRPCVYDSIATRSSESVWLKVHDAYTHNVSGTPLLGRGTACAIYLVRDPRDVAPSFAHHLNVSIDDAIRIMNNSATALCQTTTSLDIHLRQKLLDWSSHVTSWLDQHDFPLLVLRYEDLLKNPVENFSKAVAFARRPAEKTDIETAVAHSSFHALQRQEKTSGFFERTSLSAPFFRSGQSGSWRGLLTADQCRLLVDRHGAVMSRLGYEV